MDPSCQPYIVYHKLNHENRSRFFQSKCLFFFSKHHLKQDNILVSFCSHLTFSVVKSATWNKWCWKCFLLRKKKQQKRTWDNGPHSSNECKSKNCAQRPFPHKDPHNINLDVECTPWSNLTASLTSCKKFESGFAVQRSKFWINK